MSNREIKEIKDSATAQKEASRCLNCTKKPCVKKCPLGVNIPAFISKVKALNLSEAHEIILNSSPFPMICSKICPKEKHCESACVRKIKDQPVAIGALENFVTSNLKINFSSKVNCSFCDVNFKKRSKKVAIVGSGPCGLSCALYLKKLGYYVTVFEKLPKIGGMVFYGIPKFRLEKEVLENEVLKLKKLGINFKSNIEIGKDLFLKNILEQEKFDAIFLATGTWSEKRLNIPGESLNNVYGFTEFLKRLNSNEKSSEKLNSIKNVAVIGGGNVAIDMARLAKRLKNTQNVFLIYRRSINEMPACKNEIDAAQNEKIIIKELASPKEIVGNNNKEVIKLLCAKNKLSSNLDEAGKHCFYEIPNTNFSVDVDAVIICAGSAQSLLPKEDPYSKFLFSNEGKPVVNENGQSTVFSQIFAGGDLVTGATSVANAAASGKISAEKIHEYLKNL